ncbi:Peroxisomal biogenesis factor [Spathaspora sp. JA1]|nr:Peroxisomal biogenesis factor [Spathaspora sp. JA1]
MSNQAQATEVKQVKPEVGTADNAAATATATNTTAVSADDDVDDLDDLLDEFASDVLSKPPGAGASTTTTEHPDTQPAAASGSASAPLNDELQSGLADLIKDLNITDPETKNQFEQLVSQFETQHRAEVEAEERKPANFEYVMKETMERLKQSGKNIDEKIAGDGSGVAGEDILTQMLAGLGGDGDLDMNKLLVDMLEQLSSKEVLYEPIKDLNTKFPDYLKENKDTLDETKLTTYNKQYEITSQILAIFEADDYTDDNKVKRDQVNVLLESLQELGQPPTELVGSGDFLPGFGGGAGAGDLDFNEKDLPADLKDLEQGCKQQ